MPTEQEFTGKLDPISDSNIKQYADVSSIQDYEDPAKNIAMIDQELATAKHPVAIQALQDARQEMVSKLSASKEVPFTDKLDTKNEVPFDGKLDNETHAGYMGNPAMIHAGVGDVVKGLGETALNFASGIPAALGGGLTYLGALAGTGGNLDAAKAVKEGTENSINKTMLGSAFGHGLEGIQYQPQSGAGNQFNQSLGETMDKAQNTYGPMVAKATAGAIPVIGDQVAKDFDPELDLVGKVGTAAALNGITPLGIMKGMRGRLPTESASKLIEPPVEPTVKPVDQSAPQGASDRGVPPTEGQPQGQLFSPDQQKPTQPISGDNQMSLLEPPQDHIGNQIPYEPLSLGGEPQAPKPELQMPYAPDRLSLEPKEETPTSFDNTPKPADNPAMMGAMKKAQEDSAYKHQEDLKQSAYDEIQNQQRVAEAAKQQADIANSHGELDYLHNKDVVGDKSLMTPDQTPPMLNALRSGDLTGAIREIANNHPNQMYRQLADYLSSKLSGIKVMLHNEGELNFGDRKVTGYFDPNSNTIGLSGLGATSPHTILHEAIHALTSHLMQMRPDDFRVQNLTNLFTKLNANPEMGRQFPGIVNEREFVAEAFSNPKFQDYLKNIRVDNNLSMWQKFTNGVKTIFGFKPNIETPLSNALEHAMDLGKQVIEASDTKTRQSIMDNFKQAGMPNKLADLMSSKPLDTKSGNQLDAVKKLPGMMKIQEQFDFTPKAPEAVIAEAKVGKDIPAGNLETLKANLDAGGMMASLRHNNNPVVKSTFSYIDAAVKKYEANVREFITNKQTGVKAMLQGLSKEDFTTLHMQMMLDEGQRMLSGQDLAAKGWNEKQIATYQRLRDIDKKMLKETNQARAAMNPPMEPITERIGHLAGRFLGDFTHLVTRIGEDGMPDPVMRVGGQTKWGAQKLADYIADEHPEWNVGKQEYNPIKNSRNADRFQGFREIMNYIGKNDEHVAKALNTLDKFNRSTTTNYLNAARHTLDKKAEAGGLKGSEGNKPWLDAVANAEEGFKGHLAYLDTTFKWLEMQKGMEQVSKVVGDPDVIKQMPNAVKWSAAYTDHALHRNQGFLAEFANNLLSEIGRVTGLGHTNLMKGVNWTGAAEMRNWMGIGNIPFMMKHMLLPFQKMPAMAMYLKTIGEADGSLGVAGLKSLSSYYKYLRNSTDITPFERKAFDYAKANNIFNVDLADTSGKIQSSKIGRMMGKIADADFSLPEHAIRGNSFFFYAHLLEKSGMPVESALSAAEHLSKFLYTDYAPHEAPRGAAKGVWISQLALQVTRYKANELSQLGFFNRERIGMTNSDHTAMQKIMSNTPLMVHVGSLLAFTGVTGMLAYKEMDEIYSLFSKYLMGKPDNLTAVLQRTNAPDLVKYGLSAKLGIDSKISEAQLLPSPFPTTKAEINQLGVAFDAARYHDAFHAKQLGLSMLPSTLRGPAENAMFTGSPETKGPHAGSSLYQNPNTGEGRVWRTPEQQTIRNIGFHTTAETNETQNTYSKNQLISDNRDLADHVLTKAKGLIASGSFTMKDAQELGKSYTQYRQAGQPDFATALMQYRQAQRMSQSDAEKLKLSNDKNPNGLKIFMGK